MTTQYKKNHITILVIFAMSIVPFGIAWYLAKNPETLRLGASNGELITPLVTTESQEFTGYDAFSADNLKELQGHWVLVNLINGTECPAACEDALYKSQQISLMMGKDISRLRRAVVLLQKTETPVLSSQWMTDGHLLKLLVTPALQEKLNTIVGNNPLNDGLLLMDPLGNLMMKYPSGYDAYKVKSDLSKLLKISQIG